MAELATLLRVVVMTTMLQPQATFVVQAENPLAFARPDEVLAIPWSTVVARIPGASARM